MAVVDVHAFSPILGMGVNLRAILPQRGLLPAQAPVRRPDGSGAPVLFLLHGLSDDHAAWTRWTAIERYAAPYGLSVIMPNVHRSYFCDMQQGPAYWTFLTEELPVLIDDLFGLRPRPQETYVAGLSMGGYGAFKCALRLPHRFAAAASLSGALDVARFASEPNIPPERQRDWALIFGDRPVAGSDDDLLALARRRAGAPPPCPRLYQWCGTSDFLYADNVRFRDAAQSLGLPLTYEEGPGDHDWSCWDRGIERVLRWMLTPNTHGGPDTESALNAP